MAGQADSLDDRAARAPVCEVSESRDSGGYRVFSLLDAAGPEPDPGQFYMLATERRWEQGEGARSCPGRSRSPTSARRRAASGSTSCSRGSVPAPSGSASSSPASASGSTVRSATASRRRASLRPAPPARSSSAGASASRPLALLRRRFGAGNVPVRVLLGFRDQAHSGGLDDLFACCEVGLASEDGHIGHRGYVTDLLAAMLGGDDAASAAVYACGPPPMLDAVGGDLRRARGRLRAGDGGADGLRLRRLLRLRRAEAGGGYMRLCVDGPVVRGALTSAASSCRIR